MVNCEELIGTTEYLNGIDEVTHTPMSLSPCSTVLH
jgi:hypothetical protein